MRAKQAAAQADPAAQPGGDDQNQPIIADPVRLDRRRWVILIKRIYQADPLLCPKCGGTMKIIAFIEPRQGKVIHKVLEHCGLWQVEDEPWRDSRSHAPPQAPPPSRPARSIPEPDPAIASGITYEIDLDFIEHAHREDLDQPELPWDA